MKHACDLSKIKRVHLIIPFSWICTSWFIGSTGKFWRNMMASVSFDRPPKYVGAGKGAAWVSVSVSDKHER
jgi:hypothetical protein